MNQILSRILMLCAFVASISLAEPLRGQSEQPITREQPAPAEKKARRKVYKGTIEAIDTSAGTLTVKKATTNKTFKIAADARFATSDNKNSSLAPLQPGDEVNVRFTEDGDAAIAHHIAQTRKKGKTGKSP